MKLRPCLVLGAALVLAVGNGHAVAQQSAGDAASLLPLPTVNTQLANPAPQYAAPSHRVASLPGRSASYNGSWAGYRSEQEEVPAVQPVPESDDYENAMDSNWGGDCASCLPRSCGPRWWAGIYGLYMTRDRGNDVWLTVDDAGTGGTGAGIMSSRSADMDWLWGAEFRVGRTLGSCGLGFEVVYWGLDPDAQEANILSTDYAGNIITPLTVDNLNIGATNVADWYDDADRHRLRRSNEFHNVEINLLRLPGFGGGCFGGGCGSGCCGNRFSCGGTFGVRYFRMNEGFQFSADDAGVVFGDNGIDELHYGVDTRNSLIGVQLGCLLNYRIGCRSSLFLDTKFGVYGNHITSFSRVHNGNGDIALVNNGPNNGEEFWVRSSKNDVSFLGELRLGGTYQINSCWSATLAYRAVAVTGLALTTNQIPYNFGDLDAVSDIDSNGSLILHGLQFGVERRF